MPFALTDLRKYAKRGDELTIVNRDHLLVLIVRNSDGLLFPCRVEVVGDEMPDDEIKVKEVKPQLELF